MSPNFICIGSQKSATSWLYFVLKKHPNVWVPPTKELHYFNLHTNENSHFYQIITRQNNFNKSVKRFRFTPLYRPIWVYKFLFRKRTYSNYLSLFSAKKFQVSGEITPAYARLDLERIASIYSSLPNLKIIYILRHPIRRNWSSVCMAMIEKSKRNEISNLSLDLLTSEINRYGRIQHSNYVDNLNRWEAYFPSDQIFIGYFDQIKDEPEKFAKSLFEFLELPRTDFSIFDTIFYQVGNSFSSEITPEVLLATAKAESQNIIKAHKRFNNEYTQEWMNDLNSILMEANNFKPN